jgi:hypothetical protein
MLKDILNSMGGGLSGVLKEANLGEDSVGDLVETTVDSITETTTEEVASGNSSGIMDLFSGKSDASSSNSIVSKVVSKLTSAVAGKFGIDPKMAANIAQKVVPMAIKAISSKFNADDSQDESGLLSMLGGGDSGNMLDKGKNLMKGLFN